MEKRLRSSASASSAEEILSSATSLAATKPGKSSLRSLIFSLPASSGLFSSLPVALHLAVSRSLDAFKNSISPSAAASSPGRLSRSPPLKRSRPDTAAATKPEGPGAPVSSETLEHLKNIKSYAFVAYLCFSHPKKRFAPSDLLPSVGSLHGSLVLYEMDQALLSQVASICEEWWKAKLPGRENLVSQSLPYLLSKSLTEGKKADVRRVYNLREAFLLFDYMDESIEDMRMLLVRCVITPVYLKIEEGRKFVAFMLGLNEQLMKEALTLIKSQIPFGRKSVLEAYADILFRAWKGSEGAFREEIEDGFMQGLIEGAVYASSKFLAASVRRVLGGFIQQRITDGVEKLLLRLVEPVLFRSLQVANSNVRHNALHLLLDMFPLEDPDVTKEVKDSLLNKQFFLLEKLLLDDCPEIRSVAVEGSCRILRLFWEVIPSSTITKFLSKIVESMSYDMCNEVRISSINGIIYLLDNPQSHEIMKVLLPRLGSFFFDPVLSVRAAVVDLLLLVHDTRTIQFNKLVGLDDLLSSLANDHPRVARKITKLLIPSYFPSKLAIKEACSRFIALIKRSPDAGARFCEFAFSEGASSKSLLELARVCISLALSPKGLGMGKVDALLIASSNICQSLSTELPVKTALSSLLSAERLKHMLTAAASERAQTAILRIASLVSTDNLAGLHDKCMAIIRNSTALSDNIERQDVVKAAQKLICSCGWFSEMFEELANILQETASNFYIRFGLGSAEQTLKSSKKKAKLTAKTSARRVGRTTGKGSQNPDTSSDDKDFVVAAAAAWQVQNLLATEMTRNNVLKSPISGVMFSALAKLLHLILKSSSESSGPPTEVFYLANNLLDLIASIELYVGTRHASSIISVAKPWLPILLLGLGCNQLMPDKESTLDLADLIGVNFPLWLSVLGKSQLHRDGDSSQDDDNQTPALEVPVFENLMEMLLILLKKGNQRILDAVGGVILAGLELSLKNADFVLVFGLLQFTCIKLLGNKSGPLEELELMHSSLRKVYQLIEKDPRDHHIGEDGRHQLESAKSLIRSVLPSN
ncbi:hypothetical protein Cni_G24203 [Canna indica]|uniref:Condensin-2 complex subunit G2 n=1 Tax=Canna indica TaxID=4628 RepID=A0AAQ3L208_9LILI|nr:hypothetical protein Cni_G24203 [Canna indica]